MKITNKCGLSQSWVNAVTKDNYQMIGDFSCTTLNIPPRIYYLKQRHDDDIVEDVVDRIWMLLGSACHYVLEQAAEREAITEQRFSIKVLDKQISMCPDRIEKFSKLPNGHQIYKLIDFKITSLYAIKNGLKSDWIAQTNIYAYGLRQIGFDVRHIAVECLLKDWSYTERYVKNTRDYPDSQVVCVPVQVWSDEKCVAYLESRVQGLLDAAVLPDDQLPFCTDSERWAKPSVYAVKKKGSDRALNGGARFKTIGEAKAFANTKKYPCEIEFRKGENTRCERYCPAAKFCNQKRMLDAADPF